MIKLLLSLKNKPLKTTHSYEYTFDNGHVKLTIAKNSILLPVFDERRNRQIGYLLDGPIGITADLLVHSSGGAVGEILEETYSLALIIPVHLPFLTADHVKEKAPLEDVTHYERFLARQKFRFLETKNSLRAKENQVLIHTNEPEHMWLINGTATFLLKERELIGRKGENKLVWYLKKEVIMVNEKGKLISTKEVFSQKKMQELFHKHIELPLNNAFDGIRKIFSSF